MIISQIVAVAANGVIGHSNDMPWHIPSDLLRFKRLTMDHYVIMGRKTFDSLPKKLEGRRIIILSMTLTSHPDYPVVRSLVEALELVKNEKEVFIAGGGMLYRESMPYTERIYLTEVDLCPQGDTTYPLEDLVDFCGEDDFTNVCDGDAINASDASSAHYHHEKIIYRYKLYTRKKKQV